jgi:hypothetical protein
MRSELEGAVRAGNVLRQQWPGRETAGGRVNLYLGSGRFGACFDAWGLMHAGRDDAGTSGAGAAPAPAAGGNTVLMHAEHWHRDAAGVEARLPLARLVWADGPPPPPATYRQHLDLFDGRLTTELGWPGRSLTLVAQFHPEHRDVLAVEVRYASDDAGHASPPPALLLAPETRVRAGAGAAAADPDVDALAGEFQPGGPTADGMAWVANVTVGTAESIVALNVVQHDGLATIRPSPDGARIEFAGARGRHVLLVGAGAPSRGGTVADDLTQWTARRPFADAATAAWHKRWGDAYVRLPDAHAQALWARSAYYLLSSYGPDAHCPAPSHGWTGNGPGTHAPGDVAAVVPALLRLGHTDIARSIVEFYRARVEAMRAFTRRVWPAAEGTMWPPQLPVGPGTRLFAEGVPDGHGFDLAAAACPARAARETSLYLRDKSWAQETAWPIVHESARFFASLLEQQRDGRWALGEVPFTDGNKPGAIVGARHCLQAAIAMAGEVGAGGHEFANYRGILSDGLAFPSEVVRRLADKPPEPTAVAQVIASYGVDAEAVQFSERPDAPSPPFSLARHGAFVQNVLEALITNDRPKEWDGAAFANLRSADGKLHHGR